MQLTVFDEDLVLLVKNHVTGNTHKSTNDNNNTIKSNRDQTYLSTKRFIKHTTMASDDSLQAQIDDLKAQVAKQHNIVVKTAQQMLAMQVKETKAQMDAIPNPGAIATGGIDTTEFATNEDLVQLVGELQGQLNLLEQKSVLRTINAHQSADEDILIPLPNVDGIMPVKDVFPHSIAEFKTLAGETILHLAKFYHLLPPTLEERAKMQAFVDGKIENPNDAGDYEAPAEDYPPETIDEMFSELADFLGVSHIKRD